MQCVEGSQGLEENKMIQNVQNTSEVNNFAQEFGALLGSLVVSWISVKIGNWTMHDNAWLLVPQEPSSRTCAPKNARSQCHWFRQLSQFVNCNRYNCCELQCGQSGVDTFLLRGTLLTIAHCGCTPKKVLARCSQHGKLESCIRCTVQLDTKWQTRVFKPL